MKHCAYVQVELFMERLTFDSFTIFSVLNCMEFENIVVDYSIISSATKRKAFFQTISVKTISSVVTALQNSENNDVSSAITCAARYWLLKQCARFSVTTAGIMGSTTSNAIHFEIWNLHVRFEPAPATQDSVDYQVCLYKQYKRLHKNIVGVTCASAPVIMVNVVCCIVCFLLKLRLITTSFTLPVKYSAESSELTPLPEKKRYPRSLFSYSLWLSSENLYLLFFWFMITTKFRITNRAKRPNNDNSDSNMKRATIKMKTHLNFVANIPSHLKCTKTAGEFPWSWIHEDHSQKMREKGQIVKHPSPKGISCRSRAVMTNRIDVYVCRVVVLLNNLIAFFKFPLPSAS